MTKLIMTLESMENSVDMHDFIAGDAVGAKSVPTDECGDLNAFQCTLENATDTMCIMIAIARLFDQHSIPYVVWGTCCMAYHGAPTLILDISFVIPDERFDEVLSLFSRYPGILTRCHCTSIHFTDSIYSSSIPPAHFQHSADPDVETPIELWKQSDVMPMVDLGKTSTDIVLDTPERKSCKKEKLSRSFHLDAVHVPDFYQIRYLSAPRMREIGTFLAVRDVGHKMDWAKWMEYVSYAHQYVDEEKLAPGFKNEFLEKTHRNWIIGHSPKDLLVAHEAMLAEGIASSLSKK